MMIDKGHEDAAAIVDLLARSRLPGNGPMERLATRIVARMMPGAV